MTLLSSTHFLEDIAGKVENGERLSFEEGLSLFSLSEPDEIDRLGQIADEMRKRKVGNKVRFASTLFFHPTNLCELNCQFCSFYAKPGWEKAWFLTPEQAEEKIRRYPEGSLNEIHIVGGLWRECDLPYYEELFTRIHAIDPNLHIKALTPVEYDFLAKLHKISLKEVFVKMKEWGLGSLPGGGAEVLVEEIRKKIAPGKITSQEWLDIHGLVHSLGLNSNATMLFNHIESEEDLIHHMVAIREQQDLSHGFKTFIPLLFGQEDNALGKRKKRLREKPLSLVYPISRLMVDNVPHLKVLWNYVGVDQALDLLQRGGDDLSSTNVEERVILMAGGGKDRMDVARMRSLIEGIGREPCYAHSGSY